MLQNRLSSGSSVSSRLVAPRASSSSRASRARSVQVLAVAAPVHLRRFTMPPATPSYPSLMSGEDFRYNINIDAAAIPHKLKKECVLFYAPETEELAHKVAALGGGSIELGSVKWRCERRSAHTQSVQACWPTFLCHGPPHTHAPDPYLQLRLLCRKFADGFPDLFVDKAIDIRNKHVAFLASFHNPSVIFEQISVIYALPRLFVGSFTLVLPFFPTGTMERVSALSTPIAARQ